MLGKAYDSCESVLTILLWQLAMERKSTVVGVLALNMAII